MEYKKIIISLILAIFLLSITSVCASEIDDTIASEDTKSMELSIDEIDDDNLQTDEKNIQVADDETLSAQEDEKALSPSMSKYSNLAQEIGSGGNITLQYDYYDYDEGSTITISVADSVIDGNGAVIDMIGSNIRAFNVTASGVTFKNLSIKYATYNGFGGAIYFTGSGTVTDCNFVANAAKGEHSNGGAVYFLNDGVVTNCNFTGNVADYNGAAVFFSKNAVLTNSNFIGNTATYRGGAVYIYEGTGTVFNCSFKDNTATDNRGGAVFIYYGPGTLTNCIFNGNSAKNGGAISSENNLTVVADTCIFKKDSDTIYRTSILSPTLNADNFTAAYGSGDKLTFDLRTNSSLPVTNGNISISVYFKDNNTWVGNYSCLSGDGWTVNLPVGSYYAIFNTEYVGAQPINRTVTVTMPNVRYYINVTSVRSNVETVSITAKSDIPKDILWDGKLIFILPNGTEIAADYAGNGIWEASYTFDEIGVYEINAKYVGLENIDVNNGNVTFVGPEPIYSCLAREIGSGGNIVLQFDHYTYDNGGTITITQGGVIDGRGAVIDMAGSNIRAFTVTASGVTFKNLTIKNVNYNGDGGAIYFNVNGDVLNCNFTDNTVSKNGGALCFKQSSTGSVTNCIFTKNHAASQGGAINFEGSNINVVNCIFTNNSADNQGGAVYLGMGSVKNCSFSGNSANQGGAIRSVVNADVADCNFTDNKATGNYDGGGAIYMHSSGNVNNCNFTGNYAVNQGGAIRIGDTGSVANCNFTGNSAVNQGGAIRIYNGSVANCNFSDNTANIGGAICLYNEGIVSNCNFADNTANEEGGAIWIDSGTVSNCNFTNNSATFEGGAVNFYNDGNVENCNFVGNTANDEGGAVCFSSTGSVTNCNFTGNTATHGGAVYIYSGSVSNSKFTGNNATAGSAIYYNGQSGSTQTVTQSTFFNNRADAEALDVVQNENKIIITFTGKNNLLNAIYSGVDITFTGVAYWGANGNESITGSISRSNKQAGQNITVSIMVNDEVVSNKVYVTNQDGAIVLDNDFGDNYLISIRHDADSYYTEAKKIISKNKEFYVNVTSLSSNNRTVNLTLKSNIPNDIIKGELQFILQNNAKISANYAGNGTWWAVHTFDDYGVHPVTASYSDALDNLTVNSGNITINKVDSTINLEDIVLDYDDSKNITVAASGATGITAKIDGVDVDVINNYTIQISSLDAGNHTLTVTTIPDEDHNPVTKTVNITVNKADSTLTVDDIIFDYGSSASTAVSITGADAINASVVGHPEAVVKVNGTNITVSGLNAGTYTLTVTTIADKNHNSVTKNATITVNKIDVALNVNDVVLDYRVPGNVTAVVDGATGIVAKIGENELVVDGYVISIPALDAGIHTLTVTAIGDVNHNNVTKNATILVNKIKTEITGVAITATYNVNKNLVITLKDSNGKALSGVKVTVNLNGAKTYTTDKNGQLKVSTRGLAPKKYTAKVAFNGDAVYDKSAKDIKVTVKKATPKLTAKKKTFKRTVKTKKYTIVLKDNTGKAIKKAKVTIKIGKKTYAAKTNSKGKASFKIKKLTKKGTYKATVTFKGNKYYNKVVKKVKIKIK